MCNICKDMQILRNGEIEGYKYCDCTGAANVPVYNPLLEPRTANKSTRTELQEYYGVVDYPVSESVADTLRNMGFFVPAHLVRLPDSLPVETTDSETDQRIAQLHVRIDEILMTINEMVGTQAKELEKIKDYLRGQHEERKQENVQKETLPTKPNYKPRGGI